MPAIPSKSRLYQHRHLFTFLMRLPTMTSYQENGTRARRLRLAQIPGRRRSESALKNCLPWILKIQKRKKSATIPCGITSVKRLGDLRKAFLKSRTLFFVVDRWQRNLAGCSSPSLQNKAKRMEAC